MISLQEKLSLADNRPAGFDYLRLILAVGVIAQHTINVSYGNAAAQQFFETPARGIAGLVLPMFFALSGFLVAGSLVRSMTLISFACLRVVRIVPALAVEVLLAALILGPLFTTLPLGEYFSSHVFWRYFLNIVGEIQYVLPGVFHDNPLPNTVNGQLWTVPFELRCYLALGLLAFFGLFRNKWVLLASLGAMQVVLFVSVLRTPPEWTPVVVGPTLVSSFLAGALLFQLRSLIAWNAWLFAASAVASAALLLLPLGDYLLALPAAYMTVFLGLANPARAKLLLSGDYSYGLFLYGFPIQQAMASITGPTQHWLLSFALSMPLATVVAVASWWLVEKPALRVKPALVRFERWVTETLPAFLSQLTTPSGLSVLVVPASRPVEARPNIAEYRGYVPSLQLQRTRFRDFAARVKAIFK